jgi:hypothetical protein
MTPVEHRLVDDLKAFADITVTDRDVQRARDRLDRRLVVRSRWRSRVTRLAVAASVVAVVVGATWWLAKPDPAANQPARRPTAPSITSQVCKPTNPAGAIPQPSAATTRVKVSVGLPPPGAKPSTPECGELVLAYLGGGLYASPEPFFLYADGRLIRFHDEYRPEGPLKGFIEQRLTAAGVQLMLAEVRSNALLASDHLPMISDRGLGLWVRHGDRFLPVDRLWDEQSLLLRLADPESWMPDNAWVDRQLSGYVPARFELCFSEPPSTASSRGLSLLPPGVADLLRDEGIGRSATLSGEECVNVTTDKARVIADALEASGARPDLQESEQPTYIVPTREADEIWISFAPILPHGVQFVP